MNNIIMKYEKGDIVRAVNPKSRWLTNGKEYAVEWISVGGDYLGVRNDQGKIKPYSIYNNFESVTKGL